VLRTHAVLVRGGDNYGITVAMGATVELERTYIEASTGAAIVASSASRVTADELVVRSPRGSPAQDSIGVLLTERSTGTIRRTLIEGTVQAAVLTTGASTSVGLESVIVRDTLDDPTQTKGMGLYLEDQAVIRGERVALERVRSHAIYLGTATTGTFEDLSIVDQRRNSVDSAGSGLWLVVGASVEVTRGRLAQVDGYGVNTDSSTVRLTDVAFEDVTDDVFLSGLEIKSSELVADRVTIERTTAIALAASGRDPKLTLRDLRIADVGRTGIYLGGVGDQLDGERIAIGPTGWASLVGTGDTRTDVRELHAFDAMDGAVSRVGALTFKEEAGVAIDRFLVEGSLVVGLDLERATDRSPPKQLSNGEVRKNRWGIIWRGAAERVAASMKSVKLVDNQELRRMTE
jgi:hypothetical protein